MSIKTADNDAGVYTNDKDLSCEKDVPCFVTSREQRKKILSPHEVNHTSDVWILCSNALW